MTCFRNEQHWRDGWDAGRDAHQAALPDAAHSTQGAISVKGAPNSHQVQVIPVNPNMESSISRINQSFQNHIPISLVLICLPDLNVSKFKKENHSVLNITFSDQPGSTYWSTTVTPMQPNLLNCATAVLDHASILCTVLHVTWTRLHACPTQRGSSAREQTSLHHFPQAASGFQGFIQLENTGLGLDEGTKGCDTCAPPLKQLVSSRALRVAQRILRSFWVGIQLL